MRYARYVTDDGEPAEGTISGGDVVGADGSRRALSSVRLAAPCRPTKIVCVGRNYREHAREMGNELPVEPLLFFKPPSAVVGPDAPIVYPRQSSRVDYEGELAVVIGRTCRNVSRANALDVVRG